MNSFSRLVTALLLVSSLLAEFGRELRPNNDPATTTQPSQPAQTGYAIAKKDTATRRRRRRPVPTSRCR